MASAECISRHNPGSELLLIYWMALLGYKMWRKAKEAVMKCDAIRGCANFLICEEKCNRTYSIAFICINQMQ